MRNRRAIGFYFMCRNGAYPIKGIDTRRELVFRTSYLVEMERTRLRELTPFITPRPSTFSLSRNGAYPIKGIDTKSHHTTQFGVFQGRNGAYPIKGIDTRIGGFLPSLHVGRNGAYPIKGIDTRQVQSISLRQLA